VSNHKTFRVSSPAFGDGGMIPKEHTADGRNDSPPLEWGDPPPGTRSFVLICDDPDAPRGTWVHWVLYNLPGEQRQLGSAVPQAPALPNGVRQGVNSFGRLGYGGPAPPPGPQHRYQFKVYALDTPLPLDNGATKEQLLEVMRGHQLAEGILTGMYGRKGG
jgi:Raf kinase inhibitor-like YbhB/YbcL family protein